MEGVSGPVMPLAGRDRLPSILGFIALATLVAALIVRPQPLPSGSANFPVTAPVAAPRLAAPGVPVAGRSFAIDAVGSGTSIGTPAAAVPVQAGTDVTVSGWVVDPRTLDPILRLVIQVDGVERSEVECTGQRPDVAAVLGVPGAASSGFTASLETGGLRPGSHTISFVAVAHDRRRFPLPTQATILVSKP